MGKTGGGRGTNGHQVTGRSVGSGSARQEADIEGTELPDLSPPRTLVPRRITLTRSDIVVLLDELDTEMTARDLTGTIELVGGAAMALAHYNRIGTSDIDGALYPAPELIALAEEIAERNGLPPKWLNNDAQGFIPPGDTGDASRVVRQGRSLTVMAVGAKTLLAMKLRAARPVKDVDDIAVLLRACNIASLEQARAVLEDMYDGEHELSALGERIVLGALGAHSIEQADGEMLELTAVTPVEPAVCGRWVFREDRRCRLLPHDGPCP